MMGSDLDWMRDQFYWRALSERDGVVDPDDFDQIKADWRRSVRGIEPSLAFDRLQEWIRKRDGNESAVPIADGAGIQDRFFAAKMALVNELASLRAARKGS